MGKRNQKKILEHFRKPFLAPMLLAALMGGCNEDLGEPLQSGRVLAWQGLQGRWVGPVVPIDDTCGVATHGIMSVGENGFGFDPFQSTTVIRGLLVPDGHLSGRLVRQGTDRQDLTISFDAEAAGVDVINGTLQSGRCRWTVTLHRG
jgi:hypothetical protein